VHRRPEGLTSRSTASRIGAGGLFLNSVLCLVSVHVHHVHELEVVPVTEPCPRAEPAFDRTGCPGEETFKAEVSMRTHSGTRHIMPLAVDY
jgi:hypothetical protein